MKRFQKNIAAFLVCALMLGSISLPASATEADAEVTTGWHYVTYQGDWGEKSAWMYYDEDGEPVQNRIMTDGSDSYYFDENGANVHDQYIFVVPGDEADEWKVGDGTESNFQALFAMPDGTLVKDSWVPTVKAGTTLARNPGRAAWCYIDSNGYALCNTEKDFDGETYFFDKTGIMLQSQWLSYTTENGYSSGDSYKEDAESNHYYTWSGAKVKNRTMYLTGSKTEDGESVKAWFDFDEAGNATLIEDENRLTELNTKLITGIETEQDDLTINVGDTVQLTWQAIGESWNSVSSGDAGKISDYFDVYVIPDVEYNAEDNEYGYYADFVACGGSVENFMEGDGGSFTAEFTANVPGTTVVVLYIDDQYQEITVNSVMPEENVEEAAELIVDCVLSNMESTNAVILRDALSKLRDENEAFAELLPKLWIAKAEEIAAFEKVYDRTRGITITSPVISDAVKEQMQGNEDAVRAIGCGLYPEISSEVWLSLDTAYDSEFFESAYEEYTNVLAWDIRCRVKEMQSSEAYEHESRAVRLPLVLEIPVPEGFDADEMEIFVHQFPGNEGIEVEFVEKDGIISLATYTLGTIVFVQGISDGSLDDGTGDESSGGMDGDSIEVTDEDDEASDIEVQEDWNQIVGNITDIAKVSGSTTSVLNVLAGQHITIPQNALGTLAGQKTVLALHTGKGVTFSLTGTEITAKAKASNMNLSVQVGSIAVPADVIAQKTAGVIDRRQISIENQNSFGMNVNMHLSLGAENAGKYANLYRYNSISGQLEYQGSYLITEAGQAMFGLSQGGEYLVTVTAQMPSEQVKGVYIVASGDTMWGIAIRNRMRLADLIAVNPQIKDVNRIHPGDRIRIQ